MKLFVAIELDIPPGKDDLARDVTPTLIRTLEACGLSPRYHASAYAPPPAEWWTKPEGTMRPAAADARSAHERRV